jgi:hypothetical protein
MISLRLIFKKKTLALRATFSKTAATVWYFDLYPARENEKCTTAGLFDFKPELIITVDKK